MIEMDLVAEFGKFGTPTLAESSSEVIALDPAIAPLYRPIQLTGSAYPVRLGPRDNLAVHFAVAEAPLGAVLVVTGAEVRVAFWGEVLTEAALSRGIRGLVSDGSVRDVRAIRDRVFPVFCAGISIPGTSKDWLGQWNDPVTIMGVTVRPGDFIVGDDDGVVVVRRDAVSDVLEKARVRSEKEAAIIERLRAGQLTIDLYHLREKRAAGR
jgi:4-hydroxy-4-methyl-2-oxoglutarate aldolase